MKFLAELMHRLYGMSEKTKGNFIIERMHSASKRLSSC